MIELDESNLTLHGLQQYYLTIYDVGACCGMLVVESEDQEADGPAGHSRIQSNCHFCPEQRARQRVVEHSEPRSVQQHLHHGRHEHGGPSGALQALQGLRLPYPGLDQPFRQRN